jgi:polysaccharide biosynthesis transport protein
VDLAHLLLVVRRWWLVILIAPAIAAAGAFLVVRSLPKTYETTMALAVGSALQPSDPGQLDTAIRLAPTYAEVVHSRELGQRVVDALGLHMSADSVSGSVTTWVPKDTALVQVSVRAVGADLTAAIAKELAAQAIAATGGGPAGTGLSLVDPPVTPSAPVAPNVPLTVALAAVLGFILALGGVGLVEFAADRVESAEMASRVSGLPVAGRIRPLPWRARFRPRGLVTRSYPQSAAAEAYRTLRVNLQFLGEGRGVFLITSANHNEGRTTTAANLAVVCARGGRETILIDADLRAPRLHSLFDMPNEQGFADLLQRSDLSIEDVSYSGSEPMLRVIPGGHVEANRGERMAAPRVAEVFEAARTRADIVLVDGPPLADVADAAVLASLADWTLVVVDPLRTSKATLRELISALGRAGAHALGLVVRRGGGTSGPGAEESVLPRVSAREGRPSALAKVDDIA